MVVGTRYGPVGTKNPHGSVILAVADSFDAITSDRAYRRALAYEDAIGELDRCAGTKLSRECVEALASRVDSDTLREQLSRDFGWGMEA